MVRCRVTIINKLGLHARAAANFVKVASRFDCDIRVVGDDREVDGASIMALMTLAATKGSVLDLIAEGEDEEAAVAALKRLCANRFGEPE